MDKCECYEVRDKYTYNSAFNKYLVTKTGICNGTKEREECDCGGDEAKCNFYECKRNAAKYSYENITKQNNSFFQDIRNNTINELVLALTKASVDKKEPVPQFVYEVLFSYRK